MLTTTASLWSQLISDNEDAIEITSESEKDGEKNEKEKEKELDEWDDDFLSENASSGSGVNCGLQKVGSSSYAPANEPTKKLYLLFHHLKLDC